VNDIGADCSSDAVPILPIWDQSLLSLAAPLSQVDAMLPPEGFAIVSGPFRPAGLAHVIEAYDRAVAAARPDEVKIGSTSVRIDGLLGRAPKLAAILSHPPLLSAAAALIGGPFKLSAFHARSISAGAGAQTMHQDVAPGRDGWPLLGFIFMVDAFTEENGATRFLPGSADLAELPDTAPNIEQACGPAGSMLLFDGSVWHGHGANLTSRCRRSVQGALIPKAARSAVDHRRTLRPKIWAAFPQEVRSLLEP